MVVHESVRHTAKGRAGPLEDDLDDEVIVAKPITKPINKTEVVKTVEKPIEVIPKTIEKPIEVKPIEKPIEAAAS